MAHKKIQLKEKNKCSEACDITLPLELKPGFHMVVNCREGVVTVVRVVFATKWKHEEKSCRV
jgi:hypothetical protein